MKVMILGLLRVVDRRACAIVSFAACCSGEQPARKQAAKSVANADLLTCMGGRSLILLFVCVDSGPVERIRRTAKSLLIKPLSSFYPSSAGSEGGNVSRVLAILLAGAALLPSSTAPAANELKFGPAPAWVIPSAIPSKTTAPDAPVAVLLNDQQIFLEPGRITTHSEGAMRIQNSQGLDAGNISLSWNPATETVTVNKFEIHRGDKVIDVLASGQTFTTLRRETNLDAAMLDGTLTANIQPEGLQVGDIIVMEATTVESDPVLKGHVEAVYGEWNGVPYSVAHARIAWPSATAVTWRKSPGLPAAHISRDGKTTVLEISGKDIQPEIAPKGAPLRFNIGRLGEATDFSSWSQVADLFAPLFRDSAVVAPSGSLRDELKHIETSTTDPKSRAELALRLVQDRTRYVALLMGQGGLVPASAEETWKRRFGDCKGKTALLLALLHELGIEAEPVLVNTAVGDAIGERLAMVQLFNHVLVRAHIGGKDYWLDGTRTGDTSLDAIEIPDFGWGLPLVAKAQLVHMVPKPLDIPNVEHRVNIDASAGIYAPAQITIEEVYRGDGAVAQNMIYSSLTAAQRDEAMRNAAKGYFDGFSVASSALQFDKAERELRLSIKGTATLDWKDEWFYVPTSSVGFDANFDRTSGPLHDVPIAVNHPRYTKDEATIRLPPNFASQQKLESPVHETLAGVEYARTETVNGNVLTVDSSERSITPEVAYKDAVAAELRLRALSNDDVYLSVTDNYQSTDADLATMQQLKPASSEEYFRRAKVYMDHGRTEDALKDLNAGIELDPKDVSLLGERVFIYTQKGNYAAAEKDIAVIEALDSSNPEVPGARAMIAEGKGDYQSCIDGYSKILEREPSRTYALTHRAMCEAKLGRDDAALADSAAVLKAYPQAMELRVLRANIFMHKGERALVAAEAEAMTRDNPSSDYAWVGAGKTYAAVGQRDRAMKAFDRALALKPYAYIYINRSEVRPKSDIDGRLADLNQALKLEPNKPEALQEKAQLLSETGDYKGALALLDQMKRNAGEAYNLNTEEERVILLYKMGRRTEAEKLFTDVHSKAKRALDLNNICYRQATAGVMLDSALQACREALKISPGNAAYLDSLGMALLKLGQLDEALDAYNQAIAKSESAPSLIGRAFVYWKKGDHAHAEADAAAARKLDPDIDSTFAVYGLKFEERSESAPPAAH